MATLYPFRALRPKPSVAAKIAAVPYDVVSTDEAGVLAEGNPLSFLRVSRAEIELPPGTDPHSERVYERAAENFDALKRAALVVEDEPALYFYRLRQGGHEQTGLAGCFSIADYNSGVIKKHERTRRDKEDDRTRHMLAVGAQTGPVFLTYRASADIGRLAALTTKNDALFDFEAADGVRHTIWQVGAADRGRLVAAVGAVPTMYIADGHHRAASAARAYAEQPARRLPATSLHDEADISTFLAVAFPDDQMHVLPYNRIVRDLGGLSPEAFRRAVGERFQIETGPAAPTCRGHMSMYLQGRWHTMRLRNEPDRADAIASLDVSILQDQLLAPILKIADVRTDTRIDFVGGARGTGELEKLVDSGRAAVAFSMYPVSVGELMTVCDAGAIMPPKSTWFEPKLRDGLLIHLI